MSIAARNGVGRTARRTAPAGRRRSGRRRRRGSSECPSAPRRPGCAARARSGTHPAGRQRLGAAGRLRGVEPGQPDAAHPHAAGAVIRGQHRHVQRLARRHQPVVRQHLEPQGVREQGGPLELPLLRLQALVDRLRCAGRERHAAERRAQAAHRLQPRNQRRAGAGHAGRLELRSAARASRASARNPRARAPGGPGPASRARPSIVVSIPSNREVSPAGRDPASVVSARRNCAPAAARAAATSCDIPWHLCMLRARLPISRTCGRAAGRSRRDRRSSAPGPGPRGAGSRAARPPMPNGKPAWK